MYKSDRYVCLATDGLSEVKEEYGDKHIMHTSVINNDYFISESSVMKTVRITRFERKEKGYEEEKK